MNANNAKSQFLPRCVIIWTLIIAVLLLGAWALSFYLDPSLCLDDLLRALPQTIQSLAVLIATVFGIVAAQRGVFSKGGTEYYPKAHGRKALKSILDGTPQTHSYDKVLDAIMAMLNKDSNPNTSEYFNYVFRLQKTDPDFVKVWNDYNYYSSIKEKTGKDQKYLNELEKYIFTKVYELRLEQHAHVQI